MSWVRERRVPWCRERVAMLKKRARRMRNVRRKRVRVKRARVTSRWVWSWLGEESLTAQGCQSWGGLSYLRIGYERRSKRMEGEE
jgi:hypothetical protein